MARLSDHDVRDAEHALRAEISLILGPYARRIAELGKAYIQEAIEEAAKRGDEVNGIAIGRAAAQRAAKPYFGRLAEAAPQPILEAGSPAGAGTAAAGS